MKYEINIFQFQSKILIKQSEKYNTKWENNSCIGPDQVPRWGGGYDRKKYLWHRGSKPLNNYHWGWLIILFSPSRTLPRTHFRHFLIIHCILHFPYAFNRLMCLIAEILLSWKIEKSLIDKRSVVPQQK